MLMKQWPLDVWGDKHTTTDMSEPQMTELIWRGFIFPAERGSSSAHNVCWFDGCALDSTWFDYSFHGGLVCLRCWTFCRNEALITSMTVSQSYELSDSHKVRPKHWWPALMVRDRFFPTVVKCGRYSVPPLPLSLSAGVRSSQGAFDLHTHSGFCSSVRAATQGW